MRLITVLLLVGVLAARSPGFAQEEPTKKFSELSREIGALFEKQDYAGAVAKCRELIALVPQQPSPRYNLACALARLGKTDEAFAALGAAVEHGFTDADHLREDPDLESLRRDPRFDGVVKKAAAAEAAAVKKLPYDKPRELPGVKTVERDPAGGLRYRVRLSPDATKEKPQRLIVWLHPSGGSMNSAVEALAPRLVKQGWALLVPTQKRFLGWSADDAAKLLKHTLPDAAQIEGLNIAKPVLLGYSAGGQMALILWKEDPGAFGGVVLDAAYPVTGRDADGRVQLLTLPKADAIQNVPFLVLVGEQDRGAAVWKKVQPEWEKAGIPVTLSVVPGKGHAWLLDGPQVAELERWLEGLRK